MKIQNISIYRVPKTQQQSSFKSPYGASISNPSISFTAKPTKEVLEALSLYKPVVDAFTGADLILHAKNVRRNTHDRILDYGQFLKSSLFEDLKLSSQNREVAKKYYERLTTGDAPIFTQEDVYCMVGSWNSRGYRDFYGTALRFTDFGNKLAESLEKQGSSKIPSVSTFRTDEQTDHNLKGKIEQEALDLLINSGDWG